MGLRRHLIKQQGKQLFLMFRLVEISMMMFDSLFVIENIPEAETLEVFYSTKARFMRQVRLSQKVRNFGDALP